MTKHSRLRVPVLILTFFAMCMGFVLRLTQLSREMGPDGTVAHLGTCGLLLVILTAAALGAIACCTVPMKPMRRDGELFSPGTLPAVLRLCGAVLLLAGGVVFLKRAPQGIVGKIFPILEVLGALCLGIFSVLRGKGKLPSGGYLMGLCLFTAAFLIYHFQNWSMDPAVLDYCWGLLFYVCTMLGIFHLAGFGLNRGQGRMSLFWTLSALSLGGAQLADSLLMGWAETFTLLGLMLPLGVSACELLWRGGEVSVPEKEEGEASR